MNKAQWAAESDIGLHRQANEDRYQVFSCPIGEVYAVCDGMGGHGAGDVAATYALEAVQRLLSQAQPHERPDYWLRRSIQAAHATIQEAARGSIGAAHMGTTIVLLLLTPVGEAWWAHIGDSRLYLYRQNHLHALTRDHSLVSWYLETGLITPHQTFRHPESNQLLYSLGGGSSLFLIESNSIPLRLEKGDLFLLCSDGLSGYVSETHIAQTLASSAPLPEKVKALIRAASEAGGYDNATVLLVAPHPTVRPAQERLLKTVGLALLIVGMSLLAGLGGLWIGHHSHSAAMQRPDSVLASPSDTTATPHKAPPTLLSPADSTSGDTSQITRGKR